MARLSLGALCHQKRFLDFALIIKPGAHDVHESFFFDRAKHVMSSDVAEYVTCIYVRQLKRLE